MPTDPKHTTVRFRSDRPVGRVDPRLFGGFVEHLGRVVYGGLYEPTSPFADDAGWRTDVLEALQPLRFTSMRYPGGNFVSGYRWRDGIGPRLSRPAVLDRAWNSLDPNTVGTDEFLSLCAKMSWDPMLAVNLGSGTPEDAAELVAYCNAATGPEAEERSANGHAIPYDVKLWCLGNEMDGDWQIGHVPAEVYGHRALEAARMMRAISSDLELVACGSSNTDMPTFGKWDSTVLATLDGHADYISLHRYAGNHDGDTDDFLAITNSIDKQIEDIDRICREDARLRGADRRTFLCFDEWNVWYRTAQQTYSDGNGQIGVPIIEERYSLEDALVVAGFLNSFIRHANVVHVANLAQVVNAIAPVMTFGDKILLQSIYWPFKMVTERRAGTSLQVDVNGPSYLSKSYGPTSTIDASVILGEGNVSVFLINRSHHVADATIVAGDIALTGVLSGACTTGASPTAENTIDNAEAVCERPFDAVTIKRTGAHLTLPALSFTAVTFQCE